MTFEQAKEIVDTIIRQARLTREEHGLASQAIELLCGGAKENRESRQAMKEGA